MKRRLLLKLSDNYWLQEETDYSEGDNLDASVRELELEEFGIMEASLCNSSIHVEHYIADGNANKYQTKHKCELCPTLMIVDNDLSMSEQGTCFVTLSCGGLTNSLDELSDFVCSVFAQTEMIDYQINCQQSVRKVCCWALDKYAPNSLFACDKHAQ